MREEVRISVRRLVEFMLRYGDIDNRYQASPENAMQEGSRIHRMIQKRMGAEYQAEVPLKISFEEEGYRLTVEGRADGIIRHDGQATIDEIKGVHRDPARLKEPMPLHLAQAKCYAYMYEIQRKRGQQEYTRQGSVQQEPAQQEPARQECGQREPGQSVPHILRVRLTYCHIPTEAVRYFYMDYTPAELEEWFCGLMDAYRKWADYNWRWKKERQLSIRGLAFPFPYREGQKELAADVYKTIYHGKKLFLEAPTGVGKTLSTVYPAVQSVGQGKGDKIFYLTAKTITRTVAEAAFELLRSRGLRLKSVTLTAKEKICFQGETECNPDACPYAKGHYDRINDAIYDLLTSKECFSRAAIEEYAVKHRVCPFEMCLDMSLFADAVICDYNYLFDPHVYLKRFFGESSGGDYIFLIDEAHNLLERGREMYSAVLIKEDFQELRRELKQTVLSEIAEKDRKNNLSGQMTLELTQTAMNNMTEESGGRRGGHSVLVRKGYADKMIYRLEKCSRALLAMKREGGSGRIVQEIDTFVQPLMQLQSVMDDYLAEQEEEPPAVRRLLLDFYFEIRHFLEICELLDRNYVKYTQLRDDGSFLLKLFCVNPAENLRACMERGRSSILFSATFLPIQYYKKLLGGDEGDYEVYAKSVFDLKKRALFIARDVTSRYTRRSEEEYFNIACYIEEIVKNRHGNYMVFFPSYAFLRTVYEKYAERFGGPERECMIQSEYMSEADREEFLARFRRRAEDEKMLIAFCVLGGVFGEGIDLKNDELIGAVIVGTGLPQVCFEREILKAFFDEEGEDGFDYSYRYPGMNKVLQAAGRVIRTEEDVGIVALLDERFLQISYRHSFPREWEAFETVTVETVAKRVERFWDEWL